MAHPEVMHSFSSHHDNTNIGPQDFSDSVRRYTHSLAKVIYSTRTRNSTYSNSVDYSLRSTSYIVPRRGGATVLHSASFPSARSYNLSCHQSLDQLIHALAPGAYPSFDLFPVLKYLPPPFAPSRAFARRIAAVRTGLHTRMYEAVRQRQSAGDEESTECFIGKIIQTGAPVAEEEFYS
jgi:hypothetical protein